MNVAYTWRQKSARGMSSSSYRGPLVPVIRFMEPERNPAHLDLRDHNLETRVAFEDARTDDAGQGIHAREFVHVDALDLTRERRELSVAYGRNRH